MFGRSTKAATATALTEPSSAEARAQALDAMQRANKAVAAADQAVRAAEDATRDRDDVVRLEAQAGLPALLATLAAARAEAARAAVAFKEADAAWRRDQEKVYFPKIAAAAQVLDRCLREACAANIALGEIGAEARQNGGGGSFPMVDFSWPEINGRWPLWHERAVKAGYLTD